MVKYQIWACYPDGTEQMVASYGNARIAQIAANAMNSANQRDRSGGYGRHGVPEYEIRKAE